MGCMDYLSEWFYGPNSQRNQKRVFIYLMITLVICVIIIGFVLLGISVNKKVENNEYGIVYYGSTTMEFGDTYEQGIYSIPPGAELKIFIRTLQDVDLEPITCYSSDKIVITLTVSVQYQLVKDNIIDIILKKYGGNGNFKNILRSIVQNIIINRCGQYNAEDYYIKRAIIDQDMHQNLLNDINNNSIGATIEFFQLINIEFPSDFSNIINRKQVVIQNKTTILNQRVSLLTAANTTLFQAQKTANITIETALNTARINLKQAQIQSEIITTQWYNRALAYSEIKTRLNLSDEQFIQYLRSDILRTVNGPIINI